LNIFNGKRKQVRTVKYIASRSLYIPIPSQAKNYKKFWIAGCLNRLAAPEKLALSESSLTGKLSGVWVKKYCRKIPKAGNCDVSFAEGGNGCSQKCN